MMDDRMMDRRPADPNDPVPEVDRPDWEPPTIEDEIVRREPVDERSRWGDPQYAPGAPHDREAEVAAPDEKGAVGGAVAGAAGGVIAGAAVAGPPGAIAGGALGAIAGLAAGDAADHAEDVLVEDGAV